MKTSLLTTAVAATTAFALNAQVASARVLNDLEYLGLTSSPSKNAPSYNMQCTNAAAPILLGAALISIGILAGVGLKGLLNLNRQSQSLPVTQPPTQADVTGDSSASYLGRFVTSTTQRVRGAMGGTATADSPV